MIEKVLSWEEFKQEAAGGKLNEIATEVGTNGVYYTLKSPTRTVVYLDEANKPLEGSSEKVARNLAEIGKKENELVGEVNGLKISPAKIYDNLLE